MADEQVLAEEVDLGSRLTLRAPTGAQGVTLLVDGIFAIDAADEGVERSLAAVALGRIAGSHLRVTVGGLGLGLTVSTLLADHRVRTVDVIERHACLVRWMREGLIPGGKELLADPRLAVTVGDVLDVVPRLPRGGCDALLLDVDNGPGFLTHPGNTAVYSAAFLSAVARTVRRHGVLAVWSAEPAPELAVMLERACGDCEETLLETTRDGRSFTYAVYLARVLR